LVSADGAVRDYGARRADAPEAGAPSPW